MSERIKKIERQRFGGRHKPTKTNLIIDIDYSGNIEVFREPEIVKNSILSSTFDLYSFDIGEFAHQISFNRFRSGIGIDVNGTISFTISVKNVDEMIVKAFKEEENQVNILRDSLRSFVQTYVSETQIMDVRNAAINLRKFLEEKKEEITIFSCYEIGNFYSCYLDLANQEDKIILDEIARNALMKEKLKINDTDKLQSVLKKIEIDTKIRDYDMETKELLRELFLKERGIESHYPEKAMDFDLEKLKNTSMKEENNIKLMKELMEISNKQNISNETLAIIKKLTDKLSSLFG